jgi:outer membrane receptor for ferrienterochelin and colicin
MLIYSLFRARPLLLATIFVNALMIAQAQAAALDLPTHKRSGQASESSETVVYQATFFATYNPVNALDMVNQLPGFRLINGGGSRGFGGNAGNVLINNERPSSKQDRVSELLSRIPADRVARIELVRGDTGSLAAGGQSVVANVILAEQDTASWAWSALIEQDTDKGDPEPGASLSVVTPVGDSRLAAGLELRHLYFANRAEETLEREGVTTEMREDAEATRGNSVEANASIETNWGELVSRVNAALQYESYDFVERSARQAVESLNSPFNVDRFNDRDEREMELGGDLQWQINADTSAKAIAVVTREWEDVLSGISNDASNTTVRRQVADRSIRRAESIARLELDWSGWDAHFFELDTEIALNVLENQLTLAVDRGDGLNEVDVPGADSRVEEWRADMRLSDSWRLGRWTLEPAVAVESSEIRQSGPAGRERRFTFFKPSLGIVYAPRADSQSRLNLRRDVAQLNFFDFVSATNFGDDEINLGNPGLRPENTWVAELSHERRFGEVGVITGTAFYNRVEDLQDRLPVNGRDVAGNIGVGRRWGIELEATFPLDAIRLENARLDLDTRWQKSTVNDPVTGLERAFSWQPKFRLDAEFRQDLITSQTAWGLEAYYQEATTGYELSELDRRDDGVDLEFFIETTRFQGMKLGMVVQNLLDRRFGRDRLVYAGSRLDQLPLYRELRDFRRGRSVVFTLSGNF